ncbi:MAG: BrnT family toxin [Proteobacteria bacterium]|nr:BrnT family toxin [Pseudomonadota bacterium]
MSKQNFEWDETKNQKNIQKHGVAFYDAQHAFLDESRVIAEDLEHSQTEKRYYCFGLNKQGSGILTVRFTYRSGCIRIFGAGYWRKGKRIYEQNNSIQ